MSEEERATLNSALRILLRWDGKPADESEKYREGGKLILCTGLRSYLLEAAQQELEKIRQYLTLRDVIWQSFWHRNERGVLKPYWRLRHRQSFHDGVCLAQLLVAVRQTLNGKEGDPVPHDLAGRLVAVRQTLKADPLPHPQKALRISTAIADDCSHIANLLRIPYEQGKPWRKEHPPRMVKRLRTRRWPRQYSTPSWPAAYNLACVYAAICAYYIHQLEDNKAQDDAELKYLVGKVVTSLEFAITNPECEMERPSEWIDNDPDFDCLRSRSDQFPEFKNFLDTQKRRDYPSSTAAVVQGWPQNNMAGTQTAGWPVRKPEASD